MISNRTRGITTLLSSIVLALSIASPALSQDYDLFDRFNVTLTGTLLSFDTTVQLDSEILGRGTAIDFESDLGLDSSKIVPAIGFQFNTTEGKHRVGVRWFKADRDSTTQVATEIRFGEITIPIESDVRLGFDWEQFSVDYTWFFKRKDRWMLGVLGGFRWIDVTTVLNVVSIEFEQDASIEAPLPYIGLEYRFGITPTIRMTLSAAALAAQVGSVKGATGVVGANFTFLPWERVGFRAGAGFSFADVEDDEPSPLLTYSVETSFATLNGGLVLRW